MITIENEKLRAVISPKGAELQSLVNKETGIEYMWSGDAAFWSKHSPVLFPIIGALQEDTYFYKDTTYHLPRHGFARERTFLKDQVSMSEAVFTLTQDAETLAAYPFAFSLTLRYTLRANRLTCTCEVSNTGYDELLFSVGAHPAFAVPMVKETNYQDYYLQFNKTEPLNRWKLEGGLIADHAEPLYTQNNRLLLTHELFYQDAIVLKNMQSNSITIGCLKHDHGIHFNFDNFPFFGIWASKDANFVCLEPWCGIADSVHHNQQLTDKEGIIRLAANASWQRNWNVDCF
jgi:galactose mutarotase-like enzyme